MPRARRAMRREGRGWGRWAAVGALVVVAAFFSFLNAGERVTIHVGFTTLYRISLVGLVFGAFLFGMIAMFLFSLGYDRRVRAALREQYQRRPPASSYSMHSPSPPEPPP